MPGRWFERLGTILGRGTGSAGALPQRRPAPTREFNTILFHSTFRIEGPHWEDPNRTAYGTGFVMAAAREEKDRIAPAILVSAAHVLDDIAGETASLLVRRPNSDGTYAAFSHIIRIRHAGAPLYVKHAEVDVAALPVDLPDDVVITGLSPEFLADDEIAKTFHPGDQIFCLGFPLSVATPGGFPILRMGYIASYPLTPLRFVKQIELDISLFPGNSGGPAYFFFPDARRDGPPQTPSHGLLGLVVQSDRYSGPEFGNRSVTFGVILPAPFIRDAIELLQKR